MKPGKIQGATRILAAPSDWDEEKNGECDSLEIVDRDGMMESVWYPTPEKVEAIREGQPVHLIVWGNVHPPVALCVNDPA